MDYLGIDVGGTQVKWARITDDYRIERQGNIATDFSSPSQVIVALAKLVASEGEGCAAVAVSFPGTIAPDDTSGTIVGGGALTYMDGYPLADELSQRCNIPVVVDNDGKSCALGEYVRGALRGCSVGSVIVIGTGLGGATVVDGKVFRGAHGNAGEISFMCADIARGFAWSNIAAMGGGWTGLRNAICTEKGIEPSDDIDGIKLFEWVNGGDAAAQRGLATYARLIAGLAHSLQTVLDCDVIAVGGGISAQPALLDAIRAAQEESYRELNLPQFTPPRIVPAELGNDANLVGVVYETRRRLAI